ncbi:MAG: substrate-binding domain-containing protein [Vicinamibacterales bacterium]|nr:substrate-binding domain-containing protein [Vicinamibacterales bacterium]
MKNILISLAMVATAVSACNRAPAGDGTTTIAVIPKGTSHVFWQSIHAGAEKAAQELGVRIVWRGPLREDERASQISEVEGFITRGVSGIVLAPLDDSALVAPVADAVRAKIPVVIIDSSLKSSDYVSFVATDNKRGGMLAGEGLANLLPNGGKIVMIRYAEGSASTTEREEGFLEAIGARSNFLMLSTNQYGGADVEGAYKKSEAVLNRYKTADGSLAVDGIFAPNESVTHAMMRVLEDNAWAGKVKFIGFDASDTLVKGLSDGHIDGLVVQDPVKMGYLGVKTMVAHLKGEPVEKRIDTGVQLVTRGTMNDPAVKDLLHPDLSRWLKP